MDYVNDELKIYRGQDYVVSKHIHISQPTLGEICDYGEEAYFSMVHQLTATPSSLKAQLWKCGVDYTTITSYSMFYNFIYSNYSHEQTSILFGNLDLTKFQLMQRKDNGEIILWQMIGDDEVIIDEYTYNVITDYLRKAHFIEKDEKMPGNESTKMILIEDALEELQMARQKEYESFLKNLISAMVNYEGFKYNHEQVWDLKINAFMDSVKRVSKIKNADLLLQSGYSGFGINLKDIKDKNQLNWLGELE